MLEKLKDDLRSLADKDKARILQRFFKTGKGQYGEGDIFLGISVPLSRKVVKRYYKDADFGDVLELLSSPIHEERFVGTMILVERFKSADRVKKKEIYDFYLSNSGYINNWDLVDLSAPNIVGGYLADSSSPGLGRDILYELAASENLWERRISVLATFAFIRKNDFMDIFALGEKLLGDKHDLIHKAVGWMLREVGKRDEEVLKSFLERNIKKMPRTMLRYSIERFDAGTRKYYLSL